MQLGHTLGPTFYQLSFWTTQLWQHFLSPLIVVAGHKGSWSPSFCFIFFLLSLSLSLSLSLFFFSKENKHHGSKNLELLPPSTPKIFSLHSSPPHSIMEKNDLCSEEHVGMSSFSKSLKFLLGGFFSNLRFLQRRSTKNKNKALGIKVLEQED